MFKKRSFLVCINVILLIVFTAIFPAFAEIKVFEKEVEEIVGRDQSQEQVEAFALQKAKRLAVEEAGTYISSLTVVQNFRLAKDEITALASGVTQSQVLGVPSVVLKNGVIHVTVKARITVDTSILDQQIKEIMKEKGTLKKLEDAQQKVRELEDRLANLKSSEVKRLEELNAQALALERERKRHRLALDEQVLKAHGQSAWILWAGKTDYSPKDYKEGFYGKESWDFVAAYPTYNDCIRAKVISCHEGVKFWKRVEAASWEQFKKEQAGKKGKDGLIPLPKPGELEEANLISVWDIYLGDPREGYCVEYTTLGFPQRGKQFRYRFDCFPETFDPRK